MADESDDILRQYYPGSPNWLSPEDMRRGILDRYGPQNQFALPPKPRPVVENDHTRPDAYVDKNVREWVGPGAALAGAYGLGRTIGTGYEDWKLGDYRHAAAALPEIAMAMAPMPGPKRMPHRVDNPIRAYHGSPHDFDRFDLSKIGTGEGAQAYGHGLYFAEKPEIAKGYRDRLAGDNIESRNFFSGDRPVDDYASRVDAAIAAARPFVKHPDHARAVARNIIDGLADLEGKTANQYLSVFEAPQGWENAYGAAAKALGDLRYQHNPGKMYEVAIHATPDQFLDWDKPLSQQSEAVKKRVLSALPEQNRSYFEKWALDPDVTARDVYESIGSALAPGDGKAHASPKVASSLREQGIPGIRYLDQGSRFNPASLPKNPIADEARRFLETANGDPATAAKLFRESNPIERWAAPERAEIQRVIDAAGRQQTSNYVVFNPELIEIMRKYGLLGPVAGLSTADILAQYNKPPSEQQ